MLHAAQRDKNVGIEAPTSATIFNGYCRTRFSELGKQRNSNRIFTLESPLNLGYYTISEWIQNYQNPAFYLWAIVLKELNEPIGSISVVAQDEQTSMMHIGYCIGDKWWHQGYTSEAFACIIPYLFDKVGAKRIESQHDPNNPNSGKVMQKCGLQYEGTLRKADWNNKGIVDASIYAILSEDFEKSKK